MWQTSLILLFALIGQAMVAAEGKGPKLPPGAVPAEERSPVDASTASEAIAKGHVLKNAATGKSVRVGTWITTIGPMKVDERPYDENGDLDGVVRTFYPDGKVMMTESFAKGIRNGPSEWYSPSGMLLASSMFRDGQMHGEACEFDEHGKLKKRTVYKHGKPDSAP